MTSEKMHEVGAVVKDSYLDTDRNRLLRARYLAICNGDLAAQLAPCGSPLEVTLALALLCAVGAEGRFLRLCPPRSRPSAAPIAKGRAGALYVQHGMRLDDRSIRMDLALICGDKRIAIEVDGHAYHASQAAQTADKSRDRILTAKGWTPLRFTGQEIHQAPDRCVGEVLALVGLKTMPPGGEVLREAEAPRRPTTDAAQLALPRTSSKAGAAGVLAALHAEPLDRPLMPRPGLSKGTAR